MTTFFFQVAESTEIFAETNPLMSGSGSGGGATGEQATSTGSTAPYSPYTPPEAPPSVPAASPIHPAYRSSFPRSHSPSQMAHDRVEELRRVRDIYGRSTGPATSADPTYTRFVLFRTFSFTISIVTFAFFLKRQAGVPTKSLSDTKYSRVWTVWL